MDTKTIQLIQSEACKLLEMLGVNDVACAVEVDDATVIKVIITSNEQTENGMGILIGRGGETLQALQLILASIINKGRDEWLQIAVDVDGYRGTKEESLRALATRTAERAKLFKEPVSLAPMHSMDRRIIHLTLSTLDGVESVSEGEGRDRRVVVKPA